MVELEDCKGDALAIAMAFQAASVSQSFLKVQKVFGK